MQRNDVASPPNSSRPASVCVGWCYYMVPSRAPPRYFSPKSPSKPWKPASLNSGQ